MITREKADEIRALARGVEESPGAGGGSACQSALDFLRGEIGAMRERGLSRVQIVEAILGVGVDRLTPGVSIYLGEARKMKREAKGGGPELREAG